MSSHSILLWTDRIIFPLSFPVFSRFHIIFHFSICFPSLSPSCLDTWFKCFISLLHCCFDDKGLKQTYSQNSSDFLPQCNQCLPLMLSEQKFSEGDSLGIRIIVCNFQGNFQLPAVPQMYYVILRAYLQKDLGLQSKIYTTLRNQTIQYSNLHNPIVVCLLQ